jgi:hypothetical protein
MALLVFGVLARVSGKTKSGQVVPFVRLAKRNFKKCEGLAFSSSAIICLNSKKLSVGFSVRFVNMVHMSSPFLVTVLLCRLSF